MPLLGTVAAGVPLLAEENIENYYPIPVELLPNADTFMPVSYTHLDVYKRQNQGSRNCRS